jgi:hypothetical protein
VASIFAGLVCDVSLSARLFLALTGRLPNSHDSDVLAR